MVASSGTATPCRPAASCKDRRSAAIGAAPGRSSTWDHVSLPGRTPPATAGRRPARTADDLPLPDGPTTAMQVAPTIRATRSATRRSRPKKNRASAGSNGARPLNGQSSTGRPARATAQADEPSPAASPVASTRPRRSAISAISTRLDAPSLPLMFATWTDAVFLLMNSSSAISPSVRPTASNARTSRSRVERGSTTSGMTSSARWRANWNSTT